MSKEEQSKTYNLLISWLGTGDLKGVKDKKNIDENDMGALFRIVAYLNRIGFLNEIFIIWDTRKNKPWLDSEFEIYLKCLQHNYPNITVNSAIAKDLKMQYNEVTKTLFGLAKTKLDQLYHNGKKNISFSFNLSSGTPHMMVGNIFTGTMLQNEGFELNLKEIHFYESSREKGVLEIERDITDGIAFSGFRKIMKGILSDTHKEPKGTAFSVLIKTLSQEMKTLINDIEAFAPFDIPFLILGETGTGKELIAKALHEKSGRKGNFYPINCGAIPENLLESELFGYEKGAFTGANKDGKSGVFEQATGKSKTIRGTVFLDELGEMSHDMQVKLLRVLQEGKIKRIGSNEEKA